MLENKFHLFNLVNFLYAVDWYHCHNRGERNVFGGIFRLKTCILWHFMKNFSLRLCCLSFGHYLFCNAGWYFPMANLMRKIMLYATIFCCSSFLLVSCDFVQIHVRSYLFATLKPFLMDLFLDPNYLLMVMTYSQDFSLLYPYACDTFSLWPFTLSLKKFSTVFRLFSIWCPSNFSNLFAMQTVYYQWWVIRGKYIMMLHLLSKSFL